MLPVEIYIYFLVCVLLLCKTTAKVQLGLRAGGHILNGCKCGTAPALEDSALC